MQQLILVIHVLTCVALVVLVLLQHGKGADVGAAFGSGASNTVFGSYGASSFMFKLTALFAAIFFTTSVTLGYIASSRAKTQQQFRLPVSEQTSGSEPKQSGVPAALETEVSKLKQDISGSAGSSSQKTDGIEETGVN